MSEPISEQIARWIETAINGKQDPDATLTLKAIRSKKIIEWEDSNYAHGDVLIEASPEHIKTQSKTIVKSRTELGEWKLYGIVRDIPADTAADTVLARMTETIRSNLLAGNKSGPNNELGHACNNLALNIDCPLVAYGTIDGGLVVNVTVQILYMTAFLDGYALPS